MKKLALAAAAALGVATFGMAAMAQDTSSSVDAMASASGVVDFTTADSNTDGSVSFDEALAVLPNLTQDQYNAADANSDGSLDETEFAALAATVSTDSSSSAM